MIEIVDEGILLINGTEYGSDDGVTFEVPVSEAYSVRLSDLPEGVAIALCDRVIGSRDLYRRQPFCSFENKGNGFFVAHCEVVFLPESEGLEEETLKEFFRDSLREAHQALEPLAKSGILQSVEESTYDEIAYLDFSLRIEDQELLKAEDYVGEVEERLYSRHELPMLFVCHASEDKPFVERLIKELDRRALHAWFDKREILVGDSIVEKVNQGLASSKYVIAVLSKSSVRKPWVMREIGSSLMRQLGGQPVSILPILIEDCELPPLLSDLKYADFRHSFSEGLDELLVAIKSLKLAVAAF